MDYPVQKEDIKRLDELYHMLLKRNLEASTDCPQEMKDLTQLDISVINIVSEKPDVIIREIAEKLKIPNSTLTSSLNRLEKKGIAGRVISPRDRRSFGIVLTEKGHRVQKVHLSYEQEYFKSILSKLGSQEERTMFLELLNKIISAC